MWSKHIHINSQLSITQHARHRLHFTLQLTRQSSFKVQIKNGHIIVSLKWLLSNALRGLPGESYCGCLYHHLEDSENSNKQHLYTVSSQTGVVRYSICLSVFKAVQQRDVSTFAQFTGQTLKLLFKFVFLLI